MSPPRVEVVQIEEPDVLGPMKERKKAVIAQTLSLASPEKDSKYEIAPTNIPIPREILDEPHKAVNSCSPRKTVKQ